MNDVSPALKVLAEAALAVSKHKTRKKILSAIRNTANERADPESIKDAEGAVVEAQAQAEQEGSEYLNELDTNVQVPGGRSAVLPGRNQSLAKTASEGAYKRLILDALNDRLRAIGRRDI
jgi:hypothetical protein